MVPQVCSRCSLDLTFFTPSKDVQGIVVMVPQVCSRCSLDLTFFTPSKVNIFLTELMNLGKSMTESMYNVIGGYLWVIQLSV